MSTKARTPSKPASSDEHEDEFYSDDEPSPRVEKKKSSPPPKSAPSRKTSDEGSDTEKEKTKPSVSSSSSGRKAVVPSRFAKKTERSAPTWIYPEDLDINRVILEDWEYNVPKGEGGPYVQRYIKYDMSKKGDGGQTMNFKIRVNTTLESWKGVEFNNKGVGSISFGHPRNDEVAMANISLIKSVYAKCTSDFNESIANPNDFTGKVKSHFRDLKEAKFEKHVPWWEKKDENGNIVESRPIGVYMKLIEYPPNEKRKEPSRVTKFYSPGKKLIPWEKLVGRHVVVKDLIYTYETEYASKKDHTFRLKLNECIVVSALPMGNESELFDDNEENAEEDEDFWKTLNEEAAPTAEGSNKKNSSGGGLDDEEADEDEEETLRKVLSNGNKKGKK